MYYGKGNLTIRLIQTHANVSADQLGRWADDFKHYCVPVLSEDRMRITKFVSAAVFLLFSSANVHAGPFCDQFQAASLEKQGAYILLVVDSLLKGWPQHDKIKQATTDSERVRIFADARNKMVSECINGKDFAAGIALGEDLAIYKMSLLRQTSEKNKER